MVFVNVGEGEVKTGCEMRGKAEGLPVVAEVPLGPGPGHGKDTREMVVPFSFSSFPPSVLWIPLRGPFHPVVWRTEKGGKTKELCR